MKTTMQIRLNSYVGFCEDWRAGKYHHCRFGQAAHIHFDMHKCIQDKAWCDDLHEASDEVARMMLAQIIIEENHVRPKP